MNPQSIRFLSAEDLKRGLPMREAIKVMKSAFMQLSNDQAVVPLRINMPMPEGSGLFMPVYLPKQKLFGVKAVSIFQNNPSRGLPLIHAVMIVFDASDGQPVAMLDAEYLTALRTGAASGLATDILAREEAETVAIFGAGVQGRSQLEAVCAVRNIKQAYIFNRTHQKADIFAKEMSERLGLSVGVADADSEAQLAEADVICTATTSKEPVFSAQKLKPGVHINGVGSYNPDIRELCEDILLKATVIVDQREASLSEAGDLVIPIQHGLFDENRIHAELGEIVAGTKPGRQSPEEITVFKSVGNAAQDLAAAARIIVVAKEQNLGREVSLSA